MSSCDVFLDNYVNGFNAGQTVIGHILCRFTSAETVKGITISFHGAAVTKWSETERHYNSVTKKTDTKIVWYRGEESFLEYKVDLLNNHNETLIPQGVHKYPFTFTLPSHLPSSFSGTYGNVTYSVKGVVRRPMLKFNFEANSEIIIVAPINLNMNPALKEQVHLQKVKHVGCCCKKSGPITFEWKIPYTGFIPGQNIPITMYIENMSNASIEGVKCKLLEITTFKSQVPRHKTKTCHNYLAKIKFGGVGAHGDRTYEEIFEVPRSYMPPNLKTCGIITIQHILEVEAYLPFYTSNIKKSTHIVIGHVPLENLRLPTESSLPSYNSIQLQQEPSAPAYDAGSSAPPELPEASIGWQLPTQPSKFNVFDESPPPTYDEAQMLKK